MDDRFFKLLRGRYLFATLSNLEESAKPRHIPPETYMAHTHWVRPVHDTITDQKYTKNGTEPTLSQHDEAANNQIRSLVSGSPKRIPTHSQVTNDAFHKTPQSSGVGRRPKLMSHRRVHGDDDRPSDGCRPAATDILATLRAGC